MSFYKCSGCNYSSPYITPIKKHIDRKIKCSREVLSILTVAAEIQCEYCGNYFSFMSGKAKHMSTCKEKEKVDTEARTQRIKDQRIKDLELENNRLQNSSKTINNTTNNNNNNNTNTMINNNTVNYITIKLTPYNDPNMEGMQPYLEAALRKTFLSVPNLIESVHFNKKYPENHNICITNKRTNDAKVFDGQRWRTIKKDSLFTEIVGSFERELTSYAEEKGKMAYIENYDKAKKRGNGEKDLTEEVHNVIYDNNEMVNTKSGEVEKLIPKSNAKPVPVEHDTESESEDEPESEPDTKPPDQFEELQKIMHDPDPFSDSEPESE